MMDLDSILDALNERQQRATYGAVAGLVCTTARGLLRGRSRDRRYSWVVNQKTGQPTGYAEPEKHPALLRRSRVLSNAEELRDWLATPS